MKNKSVLFFMSSLLFVSLSSWAAEDSAYAEKARTRQYMGGADEGDLKVQALPAKDLKAKSEADPEAGEGF